jgi:hypothetical protein
MEDNMKMNPSLDDFSYHEVVDRCHLIMDMIQNHLIEHHAMEHHPEQVEILDKAITMVWEVYQNFGGAERREYGK